jgi:hypothetical protein
VENAAVEKAPAKRPKVGPKKPPTTSRPQQTHTDPGDSPSNKGDIIHLGSDSFGKGP